MRELKDAIEAVEAIVDNTTCPDPGEGGCIGGPIPGYGCVHEAASSARRRLYELKARMEKTASFIIDLNKHPQLAVDLHVRTAPGINLMKEGWSHPRKARSNATGVVLQYSNSHGLCFEVQHEDGCKAWYNPDELTPEL